MLGIGPVCSLTKNRGLPKGGELTARRRVVGGSRHDSPIAQKKSGMKKKCSKNLHLEGARAE